MERSDRQRGFDEFKGEVRRILLEEWDPIGIVALSGPPDEYFSYADAITANLVMGADASQIAEYLEYVVVKNMGLKARSEKSQRIAEMIIALRDE